MAARLYSCSCFILSGTMDEVNVVTKGYLLTENACNTYKVTIEMLKQFEDDLHLHVNLKNNILYPKVLAYLIHRLRNTL